MADTKYARGAAKGFIEGPTDQEKQEALIEKLKTMQGQPYEPAPPAITPEQQMQMNAVQQHYQQLYNSQMTPEQLNQDKQQNNGMAFGGIVPNHFERLKRAMSSPGIATAEADASKDPMAYRNNKEALSLKGKKGVAF